tara:strand:+ start:1924 stop:2121 length:198 start_codon:yes stop_codon:yes gene_type:complete
MTNPKYWDCACDHNYIKGMEEAEGWMGYVTGWGHKADEKALKDFEQDIRGTYEYLFEEKNNVESN